LHTTAEGREQGEKVACTNLCKREGVPLDELSLSGWRSAQVDNSLWGREGKRKRGARGAHSKEHNQGGKKIHKALPTRPRSPLRGRQNYYLIKSQRNSIFGFVGSLLRLGQTRVGRGRVKRRYQGSSNLAGHPSSENEDRENLSRDGKMKFVDRVKKKDDCSCARAGSTGEDPKIPNRGRGAYDE